MRVEEEAGILDRDPDSVVLDFGDEETDEAGLGGSGSGLTPPPRTPEEFLAYYNELLHNYRNMVTPHSKTADQIRVNKDMGTLLKQMWEISKQLGGEDEEGGESIKDIAEKDPRRAMEMVKKRMRSLKALYQLLKARVADAE